MITNLSIDVKKDFPNKHVERTQSTPEPQPPAQSEIAYFLQGWFRNCVQGFVNEGYINIRLVSHGHHPKSFYYKLSSQIDLIEKLISYNFSDNIFFSVATRREKSGTKETIQEIVGAHCDVDLKHLSKSKREEVWKKIKEFPLQPTFVINSGGGLHLYLRFREPLPYSEFQMVESLNQRLAIYFGGDPNSTDVSRTMRVVSSRNQKYKDKPTVCILEANVENEFEPEDFDSLLPRLEDDVSLKKPTFDFKLSGSYADADSLIEEAIRVTQEGCRNTVWFQACCQMRDGRVPYEKAWELTAKYTKAVGDKGSHTHTFGDLIAVLKSAYSKEPQDSDFYDINRALREHDRVCKDGESEIGAGFHQVNAINTNSVKASTRGKTAPILNSDSLSSKCSLWTIKIVKRYGKSKRTVNTPTRCHGWHCEKKGCADANGRRWKRLIDFNFGDHGYAVTISEDEIATWLDISEKSNARYFIIWSGELGNHLFLSDIFLKTRTQDSTLVSGENYFSLVDKYLEREPRPLGRKKKVRHSANILYPYKQKQREIEKSYAKSDGLNLSDTITVKYPMPIDELVKAEHEKGGEIVEIGEDFVVMDSPQWLVSNIRAQANGKIVPLFSMVDPLQNGRIIGRRNL